MPRAKRTPLAPDGGVAALGDRFESCYPDRGTEGSELRRRGVPAFLLARIAMRMPWALTTRGSHHDYYQHDHYRADVGRLVDAHAAHLQPWCVDGDGHPGAAFVDDQWCHGRERRVPLSLEAPACSTTGHESPST